MADLIRCPHYAEEIQPTAKKCKHCGEWLVTSTERTGTRIEERGSADARAVTRGLKEKQFHEQMLGCIGVPAFLLAIWLGVTLHWLVGVVVFVVIAGLAGQWYWKE